MYKHEKEEKERMEMASLCLCLCVVFLHSVLSVIICNPPSLTFIPMHVEPSPSHSDICESPAGTLAEENRGRSRGDGRKCWVDAVRSGRYRRIRCREGG